ncbi:putative bifunctional diguanylate cyclase/phosphodiesterase [Sphaerotilus sp.]|uniref:putative bifunctional diguanylate cyclase/phosphodiesterase n=1 Tax=Sphaerotilus sp. TaxID=2093942 RepID=UPI0034E29171
MKKWIHTAIRAIQGCWQTTSAEAPLRRQLQERQIETWRSGHWINHLSMLAAAGLIVIAAGPLLSHAASTLWLGALLLNPVAGIGGSRWSWSQPLKARMDVISRRLFQALVAGFLYQGVASWLYLIGTDALRLLIGLITCGVLCSGALGFARNPQIGLVWLGSLGITNVATLWFSGRDTDRLVALAMVAYILVLSKDMLVTSREFVRRCEAEFEAERQSHMVSLLLSEFEGSSQDWFWETDAQGRITHASPRMSEVLGAPAADLRGQSLVAVLATETQDADGHAALRVLAEQFGSAKPFRDLVVPLQPGAERQWWTLGGRPLLNPTGLVQGWRGLGTDITAMRNHERELQRLANTDGLTGQTSRRGFQEHLRACFATDVGQRPISLLMIDLDGFKDINDAHGHAVGDALLQAVALRMAGIAAPGMVLARLGGDEFAVILLDDGEPDRAEAIGQQMLVALRNPFQLGVLRVDVRASLGLAHAPEHGDSDVELLRSADMALYAAKAAGRDRLQVFDHAIGQRAQHRALITRELADAIARQELDLDYQPVFDARTGRFTGAEALLRWHHPRLGTIAPSEFIALAEESGLITSIGTWVLRQACTEAASWPASQRVAVNLSVRQLHDPRIVEDVRQILRESSLPPHRLELEVTESALAEEKTALAQLSALKLLGVGLALDDFGTGYSSLSYLQRFRFDRIKIDQSFVRPLQQPDAIEQLALVRAVIALARALKLQCTAEGIEDDRQASALRALGCDELQGFQLGRPMCAAALRQCINASTPETASS